MDRLIHIKNKVKVFQKGSTIMIYLDGKGRWERGRLFEWQRRLRIRSVVYGFYFTTYHPEMDFTYALSQDWIEIK